jgi:hypothetical protein
MRELNPDVTLNGREKAKLDWWFNIPHESHVHHEESTFQIRAIRLTHRRIELHRQKSARSVGTEAGIGLNRSSEDRVEKVESSIRLGPAVIANRR